jgi:hypothetical protein
MMQMVRVTLKGARGVIDGTFAAGAPRSATNGSSGSGKACCAADGTPALGAVCDAPVGVCVAQEEHTVPLTAFDEGAACDARCRSMSCTEGTSDEGAGCAPKALLIQVQCVMPPVVHVAQ